MKFSLIFFVSILLFLTVDAQIQLSGNVLSSSGRPVSFAAVSLHVITDSVLIDGVITNEEGFFIFANLKKDQYRLTIQMLGYEDWTESIVLTEHVHLPPISLKQESALLAAVEVVAEQSVVESHLGKKVLRLGEDLTTTGSSALEALEIIPAVTTTPRGQIQIRGSSDVLIYINGKATKRSPSTLKFIAAESLEKIEIITNPSAKYDAEGVGGIINLVYKKDNSTNFKLELISSLSVLTDPTYLSPSTGINAIFTKNKISFFTNLSHEYGKYVEYVDSKRINFQDSLERYENLANHHGVGNVSNALLGFSLESDSTFSLALEINYSRWGGVNKIEQQSIFDYKHEAEKTINLPNKRNEIENEIWANLAFEKNFMRDKMLKISLTTGGEDETNFSESEEIDLTDLPASIEQFLLSSRETESQRYYQGNVAYESSFFNWGTIEGGMKADFIKYRILQKIALRSNTIDLPDNDFDMDMQKLGVYLIQKKQIKKLEYALGLRLEQFSSKAIQQSNQNRFTQKYIRLFPSVQLNYLLNEHSSTLGFNYTRRINRPGFFELNPYVSYEDPLNLETGNPNLQPEIADLIELNYHQEWNKASMDLSLYYRKTIDAIQSIVESLDDNRSLETSVNIGSTKRSGLEVQLGYNPVKQFKMIGSFVLAQSRLEDLVNEISFNRQETWSVRLKQQWDLKRNWKIELSEVYRAPSYQIQQKRHAAYYVNFGISKKFNNKRGSISLSVRDIFNTRVYIYSLKTTDFELERSYKWQTRQVTLGLNYILFEQKK